jgi:hypothetical protein
VRKALRIEKTVRKNRVNRCQELGLDPDDFDPADFEPKEIVEPSWGPNRTIYVVHGASCSGKSWVCEQLAKNGWYHVNYDRLGSWEKRLEELQKATHQSLPIVYDMFRNAVALKSKNPSLCVKFVCLIEDEAVILDRAAKRGAVLTLHKLRKRMARVRSIANNHAEFSGTSTQALAWFQAGSTLT